MFEIIEHTADIGLRVEADSAPDLFSEAGRGFASLLVENPEAVAGREAVHIDINAEDLPTLLRDWLSELLFIYSTRGLVLIEFKITIDGTRLEAMAFGELFDPIRHLGYLDIKAITYHQLSAYSRAGRWFGQVIIDI